MRATLEKMVAPKNRVLRILGGYLGSTEGDIARRPRLYLMLKLPYGVQPLRGISLYMKHTHTKKFLCEPIGVIADLAHLPLALPLHVHVQSVM